ncbi:hypothetical protein BBJ29_008644 [Phytophthora kernoviae]|uniref:Uncharacterized protein n=1 Tax=Phytophthora kernoviae TaxID=325452 RepID=A0A3F2RDU0_9STRA|nr:hypothetical protein BBJ29_008644 [Phytophthora kernoviae]RLN54221.1 hypothetical protein BBP00_00009011 [Phytophthora kernoviae]
MLAKRRNPVLEWKEVARWHSENEAGWAAAEEESKRREAIVAEKAARRERKVKRKAQRNLTKEKEVEFRALLEECTVAIAKSEKRTALLTQFSKENRSELDLRCNNVDSKAFVALLTALEKGALPELVDIGLQGNLLGDEGARALAHAFFRGTLRELRNVDIRQNRIRNDGMQALWNVFTAPNFRRFCPKLQLLDMRRNDAHGALTRSFCPCPPYLQF